MAETDYAHARRWLMRRDPILGALVKRHGACALAEPSPSDSFVSLVRSIVSQQLSMKAAATIFGRVQSLSADGRVPQPHEFLTLEDTRLREVGLSRQKAAYLRDLSRHVVAGSLPLHDLDVLPDEDVIAALTAVKGIGRWSAEMFLIFKLRRPDVLPLGDVGLLRAAHKAYGLRRPPTATRFQRIAEPWRPYRSVACWYLWASLDNAP